jgi:osmotically-inducible protein OsmY
MKKIVLILSLFILSSCVETVIIGAVATGALLTQEKKIKDTVSDISNKNKIKAFIVDYAKNNELDKEFEDIGIFVVENRVLLIGTVKSEEYKQMIYQLAWDSKTNVKEIINEIKVLTEKKRNKVEDAIITSDIKTKLKTRRNIKSFNYKVTTVDKTVYLFGIAQDKEEMKLVANIASRVRGVTDVISHVILRNDSRR